MRQLLVGWFHKDSAIRPDNRRDTTHPVVSFDNQLLGYFVVINIYPLVRDIIPFQESFCPGAIRAPVCGIYDY